MLSTRCHKNEPYINTVYVGGLVVRAVIRASGMVEFEDELRRGNHSETGNSPHYS